MNARSTFAWSLRRELWEHRSIYIAPLAVAALVVIAFLFSLGSAGHKLSLIATLPPAKQAALVALPYGIASSVILFTAFVVAMFYCLDALYAERRDRSILFWKSMPVSDRTTVLSKAFIPFVVVPLVAFTIALATQAILLALSSVALMVQGLELSTVWSRLPLGQMPIVMLYGVAVHALWYAPIFGWLLLVSAWAKKAPSLWAVLPVFGGVIFEKIAFGTGYVADLVKYRVMGAMGEAFSANAMREPINQFNQLDPAKFLSSWGLWIGLAFGAAFLVAAIRIRRSREPI